MLPYLLHAVAIIFATTLHEFVRAATSTALGDQKPKNDGRLTLNPINHFEPVGFLLCFYSGFGWGKPVITNGMFYKDRKRDTLIVAIMPTVANIVAAIVFSVLLKMFLGVNVILSSVLMVLVRYNLLLAVFNVIPIAPMDGAKVLASLVPANKAFEYMRQEKNLQVIFMLVLFWGYVDVIINPIMNFLYKILGLGYIMF